MAELKNTVINDTGYFTIPSGTISQRPGSPAEGTYRFNTELGVPEVWNGTRWQDTVNGLIPIVTEGLAVFLDVNNPDCVQANRNTTITSGVRLRNLMDPTFEFAPNDVTNNNMLFEIDNGRYVYRQIGTNGGSPDWYATTVRERRDNYSFNVWFKYNYGGGTQRANNIYGGGFRSRTSFYLSPGGTSSFHGALRYSDAGGANGYSSGTSTVTGNDGNWHMFTAVDTGGDGAHNTKVYIDGNNVSNTNSNGSHDTPDGDGTMCWGSWSGGYGNMNARSNLYMYYENKVLTQEEIRQNYEATRHLFGV